jgi:hypothetical protein
MLDAAANAVHFPFRCVLKLCLSAFLMGLLTGGSGGRRHLQERSSRGVRNA